MKIQILLLDPTDDEHIYEIGLVPSINETVTTPKATFVVYKIHHSICTGEHTVHVYASKID